MLSSVECLKEEESIGRRRRYNDIIIEEEDGEVRGGMVMAL